MIAFLLIGIMLMSGLGALCFYRGIWGRDINRPVMEYPEQWEILSAGLSSMILFVVALVKLIEAIDF
jgi:hypothetical protein